MSINTEPFKDIIDYYDKTRLDYHYSWDNSDHPAVHFGFYDEQASNHKEALSNTNRILATLSEVKAGDQVLDAGCGRGGSSFWLAVNRQATTIGITPVQSQITECQQRAKKLQLDQQCQFVLADYCNTPFEDQQFDVIWACESLCHAPRKQDFYQEAYRLLRPGGRLVIAEYLRSRRPLTEQEEQLLGEWLHNWAIPDIDTKAEHQQHAETAGFKNIHIEDANHYAKTSLRNLHRNSSKWLWVSSLLRFLRLRTTTQHRNQTASIRQYEALEKEIWFYSLIVAKK